MLSALHAERDEAWSRDLECRLDSAQVHVWRLFLPRSDGEVAALRNLLSPDECRRAERFVFADDRRRFVATRAVLRILLGRYTGRDVARLALTSGRWGKLCLAPESRHGLSFNVSHSGELALLAFSIGREVGVDVERIRDVPVERLADRYFQQAELATLRGNPPQRAREHFFACWTRREAVAKATGRGVEMLDTPTLPTGFRIVLLHPASGYRAAVAARARGWTLRLGECSGESLLGLAPQAPRRRLR